MARWVSDFAALPPEPPLVLPERTMRISLIGTHHAESGAVTVLALLAILERIRPEVVFAEIPRTHIDAWRDGSHGTVESIAVARYADTHAVDVVPVDLPKPEDSFFRDHEEVSRAIERTSPEFRRLVDLNTDRMRLGGFSYLNSNECIQAWIDIYREELKTIEYIRNSRLSDIYVQVRDLMERRDLEMLRNIRAYCASTARTCGAFLVGAAHRKSLIEKLRAAGETATHRIEWDLGGSQVSSG
jgi:LmbE family N-acetylglucosaminyl deacetylase